LIPYCKYSIPFVIKILKSKYIEGMSQDVLLDYVHDFTATGSPGTDYDYIELSPSRIYAFKIFIEKAIEKLLINQYYKEVTDQWQETFENDNQWIKAFLQFCPQFQCQKTQPPIRGSCALSYDFYLNGGAYRRNSHFLFGTPSQFRLL
jgi:hypothetical protein